MHSQPFMNCHYHFVIAAHRQLPKYCFSDTNNRKDDMELQGETAATILYDVHCVGLHCAGLHCVGLHCVGLHCHADESHPTNKHVFGPPEQHWRDADTTIMREVEMAVCERKSESDLCLTVHHQCR
jgi:hypothetical protein